MPNYGSGISSDLMRIAIPAGNILLFPHHLLDFSHHEYNLILNTKQQIFNHKKGNLFQFSNVICYLLDHVETFL